LSAADVAQTVAEVTDLPETTAVTNQAETVTAELAVTPVNNLVANKPQVVEQRTSQIKISKPMSFNPVTL